MTLTLIANSERTAMKRTPVISFANQKGGVAKSTSCINTASALSKHGKIVLTIDMDPQCDTTDGHGMGKAESSATILELLRGKAGPDSAICRSPLGIGDVIPGSSDLAAASQMFTEIGKEHILKDAIKSIVESGIYDAVLIDTPPELGLCTTASLTASDFVVMPTTPQKWSNKALLAFYDTYQMIVRYTNPDLKIAGILITKLDDRTNSAKANLGLTELVCKQYRIPLFESRIRKSVRVDEAFNSVEDLLERFNSSKPAIDYISFAEELMKATAI